MGHYMVRIVAQKGIVGGIGGDKYYCASADR